MTQAICGGWPETRTSFWPSSEPCRRTATVDRLPTGSSPPSAGFRQVRDEDLRVEVGAELALQSGPQVGQGAPWRCSDRACWNNRQVIPEILETYCNEKAEPGKNQRLTPTVSVIILKLYRFPPASSAVPTIALLGR